MGSEQKYKMEKNRRLNIRHLNYMEFLTNITYVNYIKHFKHNAFSYGRGKNMYFTNLKNPM